MKFTATSVMGALIVEQTPVADDRGWFARAWCQKEFSEAGFSGGFVQANMSGNLKTGTLRGLHYQTADAPEAKLIRCVAGAIYDVVVDMRPESPTYRNWFGVELSAENRLAVLVPAVCAHGYMALTDGAEAFYMVSAFYTPGAERGVRWDDPAIGVQWPMTPTVISAKDQALPLLIAG
jgi:dTDP-4-dehydrorhamnose 3,5-epimerase